MHITPVFYEHTRVTQDMVEENVLESVHFPIPERGFRDFIQFFGTVGNGSISSLLHLVPKIKLVEKRDVHLDRRNSHDCWEYLFRKVGPGLGMRSREDLKHYMLTQSAARPTKGFLAVILTII